MIQALYACIYQLVYLMYLSESVALTASSVRVICARRSAQTASPHSSLSFSVQAVNPLIAFSGLPYTI